LKSRAAFPFAKQVYHDKGDIRMEERRDARGLTEAEAIARYKSKNYPKPALTADIIVFSRKENTLKVLLVERGGHPFMGKLALPGGFANENEPVEVTAARELGEETGVQGLSMELVGVFSKPERDPRGWVVSAAFAAVVDADAMNIQAGDDAADALWCDVEKTDGQTMLRIRGETVSLHELAFDHGEILSEALKKLKL
jgi:ADP-ribose pyrophosphatase YjhB (NUDIX family)